MNKERGEATRFRWTSIRRGNWKRWGAMAALYLFEWVMLLILYLLQVFLWSGFIVYGRLQPLSWLIIVGFMVFVVLTLVLQRAFILLFQEKRADLTRIFPKKEPLKGSDEMR